MTNLSKKIEVFKDVEIFRCRCNQFEQTWPHCRNQNSAWIGVDKLKRNFFLCQLHFEKIGTFFFPKKAFQPIFQK